MQRNWQIVSDTEKQKLPAVIFGVSDRIVVSHILENFMVYKNTWKMWNKNQQKEDHVYL